MINKKTELQTTSLIKGSKRNGPGGSNRSRRETDHQRGRKQRWRTSPTRNRRSLRRVWEAK